MAKKKKYKHSLYCEYCHVCNFEIDCVINGFCSSFEHTTEFSSLKMEDVITPSDFKEAMDDLWSNNA